MALQFNNCERYNILCIIVCFWVVLEEKGLCTYTVVLQIFVWWNKTSNLVFVFSWFCKLEGVGLTVNTYTRVKLDAHNKVIICSLCVYIHAWGESYFHPSITSVRLGFCGRWGLGGLLWLTWPLWLTGPLWGFVIDKNTVVYYGLMQLTGPLVLCGLQGHCGWQGLCDWQGLCIYCCWQGLCGWPLSVVSCCEQGLCGQNGLNRADIASVVNRAYALYSEQKGPLWSTVYNALS